MATASGNPTAGQKLWGNHDLRLALLDELFGSDAETRSQINSTFLSSLIRIDKASFEDVAGKMYYYIEERDLGLPGEGSPDMSAYGQTLEELLEMQGATDDRIYFYCSKVRYLNLAEPKKGVSALDTTSLRTRYPRLHEVLFQRSGPGGNEQAITVACTWDESTQLFSKLSIALDQLQDFSSPPQTLEMILGTVASGKGHTIDSLMTMNGTVAGCVMDIFNSQTPAAKELDFTRMTSLWLKDVSMAWYQVLEMTERMPHLKDLCFTTNDRTSYDLLRSLVARCPQLEYLSIETTSIGGWDVELDTALKTLTSSLPNLINLRLPIDLGLQPPTDGTIPCPFNPTASAKATYAIPNITFNLIPSPGFELTSLDLMGMLSVMFSSEAYVVAEVGPYHNRFTPEYVRAEAMAAEIRLWRQMLPRWFKARGGEE